MANSYKENYYALYHPTPSSHLKAFDGGSRNGIPISYNSAQAALDAVKGGGHRLEGMKVLQEIDITITAQPVTIP